MSIYKKFALRGMIAGILIAAAVFAGGVLSSTKQVQASDTGDCGASSIITCGVNNVQEAIDKFNSYTAQGNVVQTAYKPFGIDLPALQNLKAHAVEGTVYNDFYGGHDVVVVNGKVVAVNAQTAGRVYVNGSTQIGTTSSGNAIWQRAYHLSNHSPKHIFALMDGEKFVFGIIEECGNPIVGDTPSLAFNKQISKDGVNFAENASFNDGDTATFRLTATETSGKGLTTGTVVTDALPAGFEYVAGSTKLDGVPVADITATNSVDLGNMNAGQTKTVTFLAKVHLVGQPCGTSHLTNTAVIDTDQTAPISDGAIADVSKVCVVTSCNSLTGLDMLTEGDKSTYTVNATAENANITAVVFSVDGVVVQTSTATTYEYTATTGTHTISAVVHFDNNTTSGGSACSKQVTVKPKIVIVTSCDSLSGAGAFVEGTTESYVAKGSQQNTSITGYIFNLDGADVQTGASDTFAYANATVGEHTLRVTVTFGNGDKKTNDINCVKHIKVTAKPKIVSCVSLTGPASLNVNEQGIFTATASDANLVDHYEFTIDNVKGGPSTTPVLTTSFGTAGDHNVSVTVAPKAGVTAGASATCSTPVKVNELPKYVTCTGIDGPSGLAVNEAGTFTALSDNDSRVASYEWTGVTSSNGKTATVSFEKDGSYTIKVTITPKAGVNAGTPVTCEKKVTVTPSPIYSCDLLTAVPTTVQIGNKVTTTVKYTAKNGATFKSAVVDFGEAQVGVASATDGSFTAEHTYKAAGNYNLVATVVFTVNGETVTAPTANCMAKVTVTSIPVEKCKIAGKEQYDANDTKNCVAVLGATTLVNTGPGSAIGIFAVTTFLGAIMHNLYTRRRI